VENNNEQPNWKQRFLGGWGLILTIVFGVIAALMSVKILLDL
jgi:hypothetical protein